MNPCIIIPLLVGLLSALFGYLLGRYILNSSHESNNENVSGLKERISNLEANLEACRKAKLQVQNNLETCNKTRKNLEIDLKSTSKKATISKPSTSDANLGAVTSSFAGSKGTVLTIPFDGSAAKAAYGKKIKPDDLKIVEGIGPKIEGLFNDAGIATWKALSEASIEKCKEVLLSGGDRYKMHNPGTWSKQALMAYQGRWDELVKWQGKLKGGRA